MNSVQESRRAKQSVGDAPPARSSSAVLIMRRSAQDRARLHAVWPQGSRPANALVELAAQALAEADTLARRAPATDQHPELTLLAFPLADATPGTPGGAIAMIVPQGLGAHSPQQTHPSAEPGKGDEVLRLVTVISEHGRFEPAARAFANELAEALGASRVAIGIYDSHATRVRAVSGAATIAEQAPVVRGLSNAMDEAIDQAATVVYPSREGDSALSIAHARYFDAHGPVSICTVPLLVATDENRELIGALSVEFADRAMLEAQVIETVETVAAIAGPMLDMKYQQDRAIGGRMVGSLMRSSRRVFGPRRTGVKIAAGVTLALALVAMLWPVTYRVTAHARLEGEVQRVLAAPVDGYIGQVHVRPGERVQAGQPVVELDDRELSLERSKWRSEVAQIEKQYGEALSKEDQTRIAIQQSKLAQARAQLASVDEQLRRSRLVAPFDGIVIEGDLSQSLGAPVKRGETLVKIAPADRFRVIVEVDERDIGSVAIGQQGRLLLTALEGGTVDIQVSRITPIASNRDGRNFFEVEARATNHPAGSRPGLEGVAKIETEERSLAWTLGHRAWQWLRESIWRWKV
ncbi:MAG: HlyD family efflux transporter periplasmic adaptor subunit [Burkholderiaceae bacterium]|nr:HlyD family efflux transporter periplasmic adaptor subunit [Burkholderiaceae bacterium]